MFRRQQLWQLDVFFFGGFWFSSSAIVQIARKSCASGKSFEQ
jgi:hypothetical protein